MDKRESQSSGSGSHTGCGGAEKSSQLSMGQAAMILLRVRKVIRKKLANKKEKK